MSGPTQSIRSAIPLPEGYQPCLRCKDTRRAITEVHGFWRLSEYGPDDALPKDPPHVMLKHWCDDGRPDEDWSDGKRYLHGHTCTTADIELEADTHEGLRSSWNRRNSFAPRRMRRMRLRFPAPPWFWIAVALGAGYLIGTRGGFP